MSAPIPPHTPTPMTASTGNSQIEAQKSLILSTLEESKAENIVVINLSNKSDIADYMIIATGQVDRHVKAIADRVVEKLSDSGVSNISVEGMTSCDWVLIDTYDIIVHLFRPEIRNLYNLEKMWRLEVPSATS